ncbi:MAG: tRNA uridine-5-carboxymethylaminomethyl(34) synthesis GTPase MnmE [Candidatus Cryptobacteroides sp.]|nr:tRNA uridine-5-carboxymethylaminomethyl(34) synthesis GTPase MnmE [Candidatus Cryptobacteroides sp.]
MRELGIFTDGTICAPATIPGTGAISIIRVSGEDSLAIADKVIDVKGESLSETEGYRLRYGTIFADDGSVLDNVIVSVFRAPHSYTGENCVEISCHASRFIVNEVLELLVNAGARIAAPGEFTRRAFVNGKMDLAQAEAVADVIASQSAAAHRVAMNQLKGGFSSELKTLREKLLTMTSLLELELDFSEEDVEFASRSELGALVEETLTHIVRLTDSFSRGNAIKNGVPVAIVGATNTGKSTLLNALLGEERAIVSDIAGTTRDTIEETLNLGGVMFRFIDTAGIRETDELVEKIGIERTFRKLNEASIVLGMTDLSRGEDSVLADAEYIWSKVNACGTGREFLLLVNKCDVDGIESVKAGSGAGYVGTGSEAGCVETGSGAGCAGKAGKMARIEAALREKGIVTKMIPISAKTGSGLPELTAALAEIGRRITGDTDETLVTNIRHYEALSRAATALGRVRDGLKVATLPPDLIAQDLREALYHLGEIVGEISTDEVLGNIFRKFCIGK